MGEGGIFVVVLSGRAVQDIVHELEVAVCVVVVGPAAPGLVGDGGHAGLGVVAEDQELAGIGVDTLKTIQTIVAQRLGITTNIGDRLQDAIGIVDLDHIIRRGVAPAGGKLLQAVENVTVRHPTAADLGEPVDLSVRPADMCFRRYGAGIVVNRSTEGRTPVGTNPPRRCRGATVVVTIKIRQRPGRQSVPGKIPFRLELVAGAHIDGITGFVPTVATLTQILRVYTIDGGSAYRGNNRPKGCCCRRKTAVICRWHEVAARDNGYLTRCPSC
jgi:hypothetical protein